MNLHGTWLYQIGEEGDHIQIPTFDPKQQFLMPGTTNENKIGTKLDQSSLPEKELVKCLREQYNFLGVMWYQTTVDIDTEHLQEDLQLVLERVMFESRLYVNGTYVGRDTSLSTPHRYWITDYVTNGMNTITLRIDNNDIEHIGVYASAMTVDTSTVWNGVIGRMEIESHPKTRLENIRLYPNYKKQSLTVHFDTVGTDATSTNELLTIQASTTDMKHKPLSVLLDISKTSHELVYSMKQALPWTEFHQNMYSLQLEFDGHTYHRTFGMRDVDTNNRQIIINGEPTFLIGTLECCIFPLTGYPPTTIPYWQKIFSQLRRYGLNHLRFHSWCPPEAAFVVADEAGIYLQVEAPLWMDRWTNIVIGDYPSHYSFIPNESKRIIAEYGNHPSFVLFSNGNELAGDFTLLSNNIRDLKEGESRFLFTLTSNWDRKVDPMDDVFIAQTVDGVGIRGQYFHNEMASATNLEFSQGIHRRTIPTITHEVGQYTIFPNMDEIKKYTGLLDPVNLNYIHETLSSRGLLPFAKQYTLHSGKTSMLLYRDEIESALRTKGLGGIQLLDLHDFPGQSTAHVGLLDSFWDEKGIMDAERFREFSNRVVPLLELDKRIFKSGETMTYSISIANYLQRDITNRMIRFRILGNGVQIDEQVYQDSIHHGTVHRYLTNTIVLPEVSESLSLECIVSICDTPYINRWKIVVMPDEDVLLGDVHASLSDDFYQAVRDGKDILFNPSFELVKDAKKGGFFPVFWSPVHFTSDNPNGLIIPKEHPIFTSFATEDYADYRWRTLLDNSVNMIITNRAIEPIIDVIPNFIVAERMTNLFEVQVGSARIIVTTMDITNNLEYRLEAKALHNSIIRYLNQPRQDCPNKMTLTEFESLFLTQEEAKQSNQIRGVELGKGKPSTASSEAEEHPAYLGNNGLNYTLWAAGDLDTGHYFEIDLEQQHLIYGTKVMFEHASNYLYVIQVSADGTNYETVVNQTGQISTEKERQDLFTIPARYVRIVYNGLPSGVRAGHYSFEVYGE